jgi:amino acid transporter
VNGESVSVVSPAGEEVPALAIATRLSGHMGVFQLAFTVIAYNGPIVVFLGFIPVCILLGNGLGTPVAFVICGAVVALLAWGLTTMARRLPQPGGFYAFITTGLGKVPGLAAGFAATMCYFMALLSAYPLAGGAMQNIVHGVLGGPDISWWVWCIPVCVAAAVLGYLRIDLSAKVLTVFLSLELALMVIYDVAVTARGGAHGLSFESFSWSSVTSGSLAIALMLGIGLYGGFEAPIIFRDEVKEPTKTIPRATYLTVAVLAVLYTVTAWVFINAYGAEAVMAAVEQDSLNAAYTSVRDYVGEWGYVAVSILLFTSSTALVFAAHNITTRYVFNLSNDGILHRALSAVHVKHGSPHKASNVVALASIIGLVTIAIAGGSPGVVYGRLAGLYTYTFVILLIGVSLAVGVYLIRRGGVGPGIASLVVFAYMCVILFLATENFDIISGATGTLKIVLLALLYAVVAAGALMALVYKRRRPDVYARIGRQDRL